MSDPAAEYLTADEVLATPRTFTELMLAELLDARPAWTPEEQQAAREGFWCAAATVLRVFDDNLRDAGVPIPSGRVVEAMAATGISLLACARCDCCALDGQGLCCGGCDGEGQHADAEPSVTEAMAFLCLVCGPDGHTSAHHAALLRTNGE